MAASKKVLARVLLEDAAGEFDVRAMVPGVSDPWRVYAEVRDSVELAGRLGRALGAILAEQHARISAADVAGWLPRRPSWPESRDWVRARLVRVVDDPKLLADADAVMRAYEAVPILETDRVLVHTDVGFHNLGIDPASRDVYGLFDYDGAAWADSHHDFRYLVFDLDRDELLDAALSVYEPVVGHEIQRERVPSTTRPALSPSWPTGSVQVQRSARVGEPWRKTCGGRGTRSSEHYAHRAAQPGIAADEFSLAFWPDG